MYVKVMSQPATQPESGATSYWTRSTHTPRA
jgi:hypothetical protein